MSAAERNRGARCEVQVVNYLRTVGFPDARRYLAGDGKQPGDIDAIPGVSIEVKDVAKSAWPSWRLQAVTAAGGRIPIVLRRTRGVRDVGQWLCQVPWDRWNELGGWVTMLYPTAAVCARTERIWAQVPFADFVALLAPVVLDGAQ